MLYFGDEFWYDIGVTGGQISHPKASYMKIYNI